MATEAGRRLDEHLDLAVDWAYERGDGISRNQRNVDYYGWLHHEYDLAGTAWRLSADYEWLMLNRALNEGYFDERGRAYSHRAALHTAEEYAATEAGMDVDTPKARLYWLIERLPILTPRSFGSYFRWLALLQGRTSVPSFEPFFDRHGGSWDEFPTPIVDHHSDDLVRHPGSHHIIEPLVIWNDSRRDDALYWMSRLVDIGRLRPPGVQARELLWPVVNAAMIGRPLLSVATVDRLMTPIDAALWLSQASSDIVWADWLPTIAALPVTALGLFYPAAHRDGIAWIVEAVETAIDTPARRTTKDIAMLFWGYARVHGKRVEA